MNNKVVMLKSVPEKSGILTGFEETDYVDSFRVKSDTNKSVSEILNEIFEMPGWARFLFSLRDSIVKFAGLKTAKNEKIAKSDNYNVGEKAFLFKVIDKGENELILAEEDKHLKFRLSVLKTNHNNFQHLYVTTIVKFNNIGGKIYFFTVKPFHILILKSILKKFIKTNE